MFVNGFEDFLGSVWVKQLLLDVACILSLLLCVGKWLFPVYYTYLKLIGLSPEIHF